MDPELPAAGDVVAGQLASAGQRDHRAVRVGHHAVADGDEVSAGSNSAVLGGVGRVAHAQAGDHDAVGLGLDPVLARRHLDQAPEGRVAHRHVAVAVQRELPGSWLGALGDLHERGAVDEHLLRPLAARSPFRAVAVRSKGRHRQGRDPSGAAQPPVAPHVAAANLGARSPDDRQRLVDHEGFAGEAGRQHDAGTRRRRIDQRLER